MKKILCPTDFSDTAQNAVAYAAKLAQATHSDLTLLNVQSVFDFTPVELVRGKAMALTGVADRLEAESVQIAKAFKIGCYAEVESTARRLSNIIREKSKGYDLIVMGSDGPDDLYQFFAGSNTYNAILESEIPVLLVPAKYIYSEIKRMVYAFDYLHEMNLPLTRLVPILKSLQCELTILQVVEEARSKDADDDLKELQFIIRNFYGDDLNFKYDTIRASDIAEGIKGYVFKSEPDALALCSVHRNLIQRLFHRSVIKGITTFARFPVFVFHQ